jgi:hypothetical protein
MSFLLEYNRTRKANIRSTLEKRILGGTDMDPVPDEGKGETPERKTRLTAGELLREAKRLGIAPTALAATLAKKEMERRLKNK